VKKIIKFFARFVNAFLDHLLVRAYSVDKEGRKTRIKGLF